MTLLSLSVQTPCKSILLSAHVSNKLLDESQTVYTHFAATDLALPCFLRSLLVCVEVLQPSQPNGVMLSVISLPNHTFTGQA